MEATFFEITGWQLRSTDRITTLPQHKYYKNSGQRHNLIYLEIFRIFKGRHPRVLEISLWLIKSNYLFTTCGATEVLIRFWDWEAKTPWKFLRSETSPWVRYFDPLKCMKNVTARKLIFDPFGKNSSSGINTENIGLRWNWKGIKKFFDPLSIKPKSFFSSDGMPRTVDQKRPLCSLVLDDS